MLYIFHGSDHDALRTKLASVREALHSKRPEAEFFKLDDPEQVTPAALEELTQSQGLFERKYIVQLDRLLDNEGVRAAIVNGASLLGSSENVFLLVDEQLEKQTYDALAGHAYAVHHFPSQKKGASEFNVFALTDALGSRNKKEIWTEYHKALRAGKEPEELHGILFWQVKSMILASTSRSASEAGMKSFPFKKAREFAANYSREELNMLSRDLVICYHQARRGQGTLADNLERCILSL